MTGTGHLLTSGSLATAILYSAGIRDSHHFLPALAVALGAALLPDLDSGTSTIKGLLVGREKRIQTDGPVLINTGHNLGQLIFRIMEWAARLSFCLGLWLIQAVTSHRGALHSAGVMVGLTAVVALLSRSITISLAFGCGYAMHILADMTTRRGVRLWWPLSHRYFHLLPQKWRVRSERSLSLAELQIILFFTGLASLAFFLPARWFVVCLVTVIVGMHLLTLWADRRLQKKVP